MGGALDGVRVVDWTMFQQGPAATMLLAEMGAEVIKIEHPAHGDLGRSNLGQRHMVDGQDVYPRSYFDSFNRSKRSMKLDLATAAGREVLYKLVGVSDVFVSNYRVGVPEKLGVDYPTLRSYNPQIIYAHATGYGPEGPDASLPSVDSVAAVRAGFSSILGDPDQPPLWPYAVSDQAGACMLTCGILAALYERKETGRGQLLSTSLLGTAIWLQTVRMNEYLFSGIPTEKFTQRDRGFPNVFQCKDGKWLILNLTSSVERGMWKNLCRILGLTDLENDANPRWATVAGQLDNTVEINRRVGEVIGRRTRGEWLEALRGSGLPSGPVQEQADVASDPQVLENDYITELPSSERGATQMVGYPIRFTETPLACKGPAPEWGQHTEEVLTDLLGYSWEEIGRLQEERAV